MQEDTVTALLYSYSLPHAEKTQIFKQGRGGDIELLLLFCFFSTSSLLLSVSSSLFRFLPFLFSSLTLLSPLLFPSSRLFLLLPLFSSLPLFLLLFLLSLLLKSLIFSLTLCVKFVNRWQRSVTPSISTVFCISYTTLESLQSFSYPKTKRQNNNNNRHRHRHQRPLLLLLISQ